MTTPAPRNQHPYFMYDAIVGQPEAIRSVITTQSERCAEVPQSCPANAGYTSLESARPGTRRWWGRP